MKWFNFILLVFVITILCITLIKCNQGKYVETSTGVSYDIVCLEKHEYYASTYALAPKLDDNGKPIKCK